MAKLTAYNLVNYINGLPRNRNYNYVHKSNHGLIHIDDIMLPSGPVYFRRWNPAKKETINQAKTESISSEMLWRLANAIEEGCPVNVERVFGASYNTRSVLEALIASTPEFYYCYPGRIKDIDGKSTVEKGHKHIIWIPDKPHENGKLIKYNVEHMAISELPAQTVTYDSLTLPPELVKNDVDINILRRHTQIQVFLYSIGQQFGYRTWIAQNDKGLCYKGIPLMNYPGIVSDLKDENIISSFRGAKNAAKFIDCIWFDGDKCIPAIMEVEHTTGITSGLSRMKNLYDSLPKFETTKYIIVAPDEDREKVIAEINKEQFRELDAWYFPYSAVEELYDLCRRRKIRGIKHEFLECYIEKGLKL